MHSNILVNYKCVRWTLALGLKGKNKVTLGVNALETLK